jgi:hypothetical protein
MCGPFPYVGAVVFGCVEPHIGDGVRPSDRFYTGELGTFGETVCSVPTVNGLALVSTRLSGS